MAGLSPEDRLLTLCLRPGPSPARPPADADLDWELVLSAVKRDGLSALFLLGLERIGLQPPLSILTCLQTQALEMEHRSRLVFAHLSGILKDLTALGIRPILLKGTALALTVYPHPLLRPLGDIDLLVPTASLEDCRGGLARMGCLPLKGPLAPPLRRWVTPPPRVVVDLHLHILGSPNPFPIPMAGVWQRAVRARWQGQEVLVPSAEDCLLHACLHSFFSHGLFPSLSTTLDISYLARAGLDWSLAVRLATAGRGRRAVGHAVALAHQLMGAPVPQWAMASLAAPTQPLPPNKMERPFSRPPTSQPLERLACQISAVDSAFGRLRVLLFYLTSPHHLARAARSLLRT